uniref:Uncharacterized protein n=1 Tax=Anguilla anguilla TaxID=7936 RepID=A0A0E9VBV5_ANGAN
MENSYVIASKGPGNRLGISNLSSYRFRTHVNGRIIYV